MVLPTAGKSVVPLRAPGSYLDHNYPSGLLPADKDKRLSRGTGTAKTTAVVSGAAALGLQQCPTFTPDPIAVSAGQLNVAAAAAAPTRSSTQSWSASLGNGSLETARGSAHVSDPDTGIDLVGERDIMGQPCNAGAWSAVTLTARTWSGATWTGTSWAARTWSRATWTGSTRTGVATTLAQRSERPRPTGTSTSG